VVSTTTNRTTGGPLSVTMRPGALCAVAFVAMASPCELLFAECDAGRGRELGEAAAAEAWRIERRFSRYLEDSVIGEIHRHRGAEFVVDDETAGLLDFAQQCYELSDGLFDITSGVLRRAWKFDRSDRVPAAEDVARLLPLIGFDKLKWRRPVLTLPAEMELDLGGIGKEYAVDRVYGLVAGLHAAPFLVNFGGDLRANRSPQQGPWRVGIEQPDTERQARLILELECGGLATSGDSQRYLLKDGVRYGHILDPHTGWPIVDAPRSVTVAASSCTEAGLLSTLALLQGAGARKFLEAHGVRYWLPE